MKDFIKKIYGAIAKDKKKSCCESKASCCSDTNVSQKIGYTKEELESIPKDADMGLAQTWQAQVRAIVEEAFDEDCTVTHFLREKDGNRHRSFYVLLRNVDIQALAGESQ